MPKVSVIASRVHEETGPCFVAVNGGQNRRARVGTGRVGIRPDAVGAIAKRGEGGLQSFEINWQRIGARLGAWDH